MKKIITAGISLIAALAHGTVMQISGTQLNSTGKETSAGAYENALTLNAATAGDYLVISTFSSSASSTGGTGSWQLATDTQSSTAISRSFGKKSDIGICSTVSVFSGLSAGSSIALQHKSGTGTLTTSDANMVAIRLTTSTGETLNHDVAQQSVIHSTSSSSFQDTGVQTSVQVNHATNNKLYLTASFNSRTTGTDSVGEWQLQYKKTTDTEWTDAGNSVKRSMSDDEDTGSVTLNAVTANLEAGEYETRLVAKSDDGTTVETSNATLASVALSYTNEDGGGYFEAFSATSDGGAHTDNDASAIPGSEVDFTLEETGDVYAAMSFSSSAAVGANQTGSFDLAVVDGETLIDANQANERFFTSSDDFGAGGSVGLFEDLAAGTYTLEGRQDETAGQITTSNLSLIGFSTVAIPEPSSIALFGLISGAALIVRRLFR
jgi:hypothetical protein